MLSDIEPVEIGSILVMQDVSDDEQFAETARALPATRKQAQFALNARHFAHPKKGK